MTESRYKWLVVALLFLVALLNYADRTALSAVFPLLKADLKMSDVELGAVGTIFLWSYGVVSPLAGILGDRFPRSFLVTASLMAWSLVTAVTGLARNTFQLFACRILLGLSESLYIPSALALIGEVHSANTRGTAMALHIAGMQLGFVVGGSLSGYLGDRHGWRVPLFTLAAAGLALALVCRTVFGKAPVKQISTSLASDRSPALPWRESLRRTLSVPSFLILASESMLTSVGIWVFAYWLPLYFQETFHMTLASAGIYGTLAVSGGGWAGILAGGRLSDIIASRSPRRRMLLESGCYVIASPFLLSFVWAHDPIWIALSVFCFNFLQTLGFANANPLLCDLLQSRTWSTAFGLMNMANCLVAGVGVFAAGAMKQQLGLNGVFVGVMGIQLVAASLLLVGYCFFLKKDLQRNVPAEAVVQ